MKRFKVLGMVIGLILFTTAGISLNSALDDIAEENACIAEEVASGTPRADVLTCGGK